MREHILKSGVNSEGALKQKGVKKELEQRVRYTVSTTRAT